MTSETSAPPAPARPAGVAAHWAALGEFAGEARAALREAAPPTPENDNRLYYPLLFLCEQVEATLRRVLRSAYEGVREENEASAAWLADAQRAALAAPAPAPLDREALAELLTHCEVRASRTMANRSAEWTRRAAALRAVLGITALAPAGEVRSV